MVTGLLLLGGIILIGVFGHLLFARTHIPESLFLILAGLLIGPILGWVPQAFFIDNISFFVTIALIIVLLDSGLNLNIYRALKNAKFAVLFTLVVLINTTLLVTATTWYFFGWNLIQGIFLGIVVSGTTAVTVIHLVNRLSVDPGAVNSDTKSLLILESVVSDLTVISAASIILGLAAPHAAGKSIFVLVFNEIFMSILFGAVLGIGLIFVYSKLHGNKLSYIFTLGVALVTHFIAERAGFNGPLAVMIFGLVLGNHKAVLEIFRVRAKLFKTLDRDVIMLKKTDTEFTFLITTFFFVMLGIVFDLSVLSNTVILTITLAILVAKVIARYLSSVTMGYFEESFHRARFIHTNMVACGVSSALVAFLAIEAGLDVPYLTEIVLLFIVATTVVSIFATAIQERKTINIIQDKKARH